MRRPAERVARAGRLLLSDPRTFATRLGAHLTGRSQPRSGRIEVNGVGSNIDLDLDPRSRLMYRGTYQPNITRLLKRFLREGDTFIDVGAGVVPRTGPKPLPANGADGLHWYAVAQVGIPESSADRLLVRRRFT
jgi:hypothetical protein